MTAGERWWLAGAAGVAVAVLVQGTALAAVTYDVQIVHLDKVVVDFGAGTGSVSGSIKTSNLPLSLTATSGSYSLPTGSGDPFSGTWTLSDGTDDNQLFLAFANTGRNLSYIQPLARSTGSITVTGGTGLFAGASGGGTLEAFSRDGIFFNPNTQFFDQEGYEQVVIDRLQIVLADGPAQIDTRPMSVTARIALENIDTRTGVNIGSPTSDPTSTQHILTNLRSEYSFDSPIGQSYLSNNEGDTAHWQFETLSVGPASDFFFGSSGDAELISGTGFFAGATGSSDWWAYSVPLGQVSPDTFAYSVVTMDRYTVTPVPEPETYALMLAGLLIMGIAARRRRR